MCLQNNSETFSPWKCICVCPPGKHCPSSQRMDTKPAESHCLVLCLKHPEPLTTEEVICEKGKAVKSLCPQKQIPQINQDTNHPSQTDATPE